MERTEIFNLVTKEREYQNKKWGTEFDSKNTPNDWVAYISKYLGQSVTLPWNEEVFRTQMIKVMALASAALEQDTFAKRHYDKE